MYLQKVISRKTFFAGVLKVNDENGRIHTKMSWIRIPQHCHSLFLSHLGDGRLANVEGGLVAGQPALVPDHRRGVEGAQTKVHVGVEGGGVVLVLRLNAPPLAPCRRGKVRVQAQLENKNIYANLVKV
jgi:hypothetical protein